MVSASCYHIKSHKLMGILGGTIVCIVIIVLLHINRYNNYFLTNPVKSMNDHNLREHY